MEYYKVACAKDRVIVRDFTKDAIQLQFVDYLERPLSALTEYAVVLSIDFMVREEETKQDFMRTYYTVVFKNLFFSKLKSVVNSNYNT